VSRAQRACYEQARRDLEGAFGGLIQEREPSIFVAAGRVGVRVDVADDGVIAVWSWIGQGLPITPALGLWLARRASGLRLGALVVDDEDAILLQHALFPEGANGVVLPRLVALMAETADAVDAELRERFATS
jgi:hypothetical protein